MNQMTDICLQGFALYLPQPRTGFNKMNATTALSKRIANLVYRLYKANQVGHETALAGSSFEPLPGRGSYGARQLPDGHAPNAEAFAKNLTHLRCRDKVSCGSNNQIIVIGIGICGRCGAIVGIVPFLDIKIILLVRGRRRRGLGIITPRGMGQTLAHVIGNTHGTTRHANPSGHFFPQWRGSLVVAPIRGGRGRQVHGRVVQIGQGAQIIGSRRSALLQGRQGGVGRILQHGRRCVPRVLQVGGRIGQQEFGLRRLL